MATTKTESVVQNRTLLVISLVLAVLAVLFVNIYVHGVESRLMRGSFVVLQAATDIKRGEKIKESSLQRVQVPGQFKDAFDQAWKGNDVDALVGRPVAVEVKQGEILFHSHFEAHRGVTPADTIPRGYRHWAIRVDSRAVPASLQAGNLVDLAANVKLTPNSAAIPVTVMRGVKVVAVGGLRSPSDDPSRLRRSDISQVTLEVTPEEETKLLAVQTSLDGDFRIAVRNPDDKELSLTDRFDSRLRPLFAALRMEGEPER